MVTEFKAEYPKSVYFSKKAVKMSEYFKKVHHFKENHGWNSIKLKHRQKVKSNLDLLERLFPKGRQSIKNDFSRNGLYLWDYNDVAEYIRSRI